MDATMRVRVIADDSGEIKAFSVRLPDHDPKKDGEIFPIAGHIAHDLDIPLEHEQLFQNEPHKIPLTLQISVSGGKAALVPRQRKK
jgi:hypothetical protein